MVPPGGKGTRMNSAVLILLLVHSATAFSLQDDFPPSPPVVHRSADLFRLAHGSDVIATGTVSARTPRGKRLTEQELLKLDDLSKALGGVLFTLDVDELLCVKTDFTPGVRRPQVPNKKLLIFKKRDSRFFSSEQYALGHRYIAFLKVLPGQEQLVKEYQLDSGPVYYEAFEGKTGLVDLPADDSFLTSVKAFCQALAPTSGGAKIRLLDRLAQSADPGLKDSATQASSLVRQNMHR